MAQLCSSLCGTSSVCSFGLLTTTRSFYPRLPNCATRRFDGVSSLREKKTILAATIRISVIRRRQRVSGGCFAVQSLKDRPAVFTAVFWQSLGYPISLDSSLSFPSQSRSILQNLRPNLYYGALSLYLSPIYLLHISKRKIHSLGFSLQLLV